MTYKPSFQELAQAQQVILSRQRRLSVDEARKQVEKLRTKSSKKSRKSRT
jgi:hypothetical protein